MLIPGGPYDGGVLLLLEHVDVHLTLLLGLFLIVETNAGCIEVEVGGDDRLSTIDDEEGGVPLLAVHTHLQAPKQGGEFIHPMAG